MLVGPIVSGIVTTYWNFRAASAVAFGLCCFMILVNFSTSSIFEGNKVIDGNDVGAREDNRIDLKHTENAENDEKDNNT